MRTKIPPPILAVLWAAAMWFAPRLLPGLSVGVLGGWVLGGLFVLAGLAIAIMANRAFRKAGTTINPMDPSQASQIVEGGPFGFSRNPMYLGMALILTGWALWFGHWLNFALVALFVWYITEFQIKPEEEALTAKFGEAYEAYKQKVRRWV